MIMAFVMVKIGAGEYMSWMTTVKEKVEKFPEVAEAYCVFGSYDKSEILEGADQHYRR